MPRYMLDTNICIYVLQNRPPGLRERFDELADELSISVITLGELFYGAENSARRSENLRTIEQLVGRLDVLPFTADAAAHYGQIRAALRRVGRPAGVHDMLIGGHARSEGLILVTNNVREFAPCRACRSRTGSAGSRAEKPAPCGLDPRGSAFRFEYED